VERIAVPMDPKIMACKFGAKCYIAKCRLVHPPAVQGITRQCTKRVWKEGKVTDEVSLSLADCEKANGRGCHLYHRPVKQVVPVKQILKRKGRQQYFGAKDLAIPLEEKKYESLNGGYQFKIGPHASTTYGVYSMPSEEGLLCNATYECGKVNFTAHRGVDVKAQYIRGPDAIRMVEENGQVKKAYDAKYHQIDRTKLSKVHTDLCAVPLPKGMVQERANGWRPPIPGEACVLTVAFKHPKFGQKNLGGVYVSQGNVTKDYSSHWGHTCPSEEGDCGAGIWALSDGKLIGFHELGSGNDKENGFIPVSANWAELCQGTVPTRVAHLN